MCPVLIVILSSTCLNLYFNFFVLLWVWTFCDLSNIKIFYGTYLWRVWHALMSRMLIRVQNMKISWLFFREIVRIPSRIWISNARNEWREYRVRERMKGGRREEVLRRASRVKRIDSFEQINPRRGWKRVRSGQARSWEEKWRRQRVASGNGSGETPDYGFLRFKFLFAVRAFIKDDLCLSRIFFTSLRSF